MINRDFKKMTLPFEENLFEALSNSVEFEKVGKGRVSNTLVNISQEGIPYLHKTSLLYIISF